MSLACDATKHELRRRVRRFLHHCAGDHLVRIRQEEIQRSQSEYFDAKADWVELIDQNDLLEELLRQE